MTILFALIALAVFLVLAFNARGIWRDHKYDLWRAKYSYPDFTQLTNALQKLGVTTQQAAVSIIAFGTAFRKEFPDGSIQARDDGS